MVDLPPGECSGCATCAATTMLHPGSASCKLPTDPCEVVLSGSAKSTLSADNVALLCFIMGFIYLMTMQIDLTLFVQAAVAALADHSSNAVLEEAVDTRIPKRVTPGSASAVSKAKPARTKRFMVMVVVAIAFAAHIIAL